MTNRTDRTQVVPDVRPDAAKGVDNNTDDEEETPGGLTSEMWGDIPVELQERNQWLMWDASNDTPRRPHWNGDFTISYTDSDEWHSFDEAAELAAGVDSWGIGYVCAAGNSDYDDGEYSVIDIDGGVTNDDTVKDWVPNLAPFNRYDAYLERSPSGTGVHIPIKNLNIPEWWKDVQRDEGDHEGVDVLTNSFTTFTGDTESDRSVAEDTGWVNFWLSDVHESIGDYSTDGDISEVSPGSGFEPDEEWLTEADIRGALNYISADVGYTTWRDIGFAVTDFFQGDGDDDSDELKQQAVDVFVDWSETADSKWDSEAEQKARRIIRDAFDKTVPDGKITVGTLIHLAQQNGWMMPSKPGKDDEDAYLAVVSEYAPDGADPLLCDEAMLVACLAARDDGAVMDGTEPPREALTPLVGTITSVDPSNDSVGDGTWDLARRTFDQIDAGTALDKFAAELPSDAV